MGARGSWKQAKTMFQNSSAGYRNTFYILMKFLVNLIIHGAEFLKLNHVVLSLQTGRRLRHRRDESSCSWMSWSYWSTNETRWSEIWMPRRNSKLPRETRWTPAEFCHGQFFFPQSGMIQPSLVYLCKTVQTRSHSKNRLYCAPASPQSSSVHNSTPAQAGSLPDWGRHPPTRCQAGEMLELSHYLRVCACTCTANSTSSLLPPDESDFLTFTLCRAEEEDEHLERTLEQNKGKMAKKEEKCVLQWLSFQERNTTNVANKRIVSLLILLLDSLNISIHCWNPDVFVLWLDWNKRPCDSFAPTLYWLKLPYLCATVFIWIVLCLSKIGTYTNINAWETRDSVS